MSQKTEEDCREITSKIDIFRHEEIATLINNKNQIMIIKCDSVNKGHICCVTYFIINSFVYMKNVVH